MGRFVARELLAILRQVPDGWGDRAAVAGVYLAVNRIGVELNHADWPNQALEIEFELRNGWLVAGLSRTGWLDHLGPGELRAFTTALLSLYKLAGVELVREQVQAYLPSPAASWDVTPDGLLLRLGRQGRAVTYHLTDPGRPPTGGRRGHRPPRPRVRLVPRRLAGVAAELGEGTHRARAPGVGPLGP